MVARAESRLPAVYAPPGWSEQDPEDWWRAAQEVLAALGADEATSIGLSGQMHGLVVLDAQERVIRPAILWNDQRTAAECEEIEERSGPRLIARTGNRALPGSRPRSCCGCAPRAGVHARIARVMLPKDYVRLRMTGEHVTDVADASGTLSRRRRPALDRRGRATRSRSRARGCRTCSNRRRSPARRRLPVAAGAGDQAAGAVGVGVDRPGPLSVVLGTSGVVFAALPARRGPRGPHARVLPRRARTPGTRWA